MRLKRLVLQGYKTFATKTEFLFDDGITAVVGPNGSGKSNVADAVRWVLGEQSYGTLRGKRTVDMIFSGSKKRARAGMAQAILTLDNSDGWLPIDYTEVEICRRAYRSGDNEYLLNGQKVRLLDISNLLARAGLAEQTYTIIGQGLIDRALSLKADERRALFEEAAGISHYKSKRASTLRKLQNTQRNLQRVHDILGELRPRLNSLRRQANRAQNYAQVEADLRHWLRIWYGHQWENAKQELRTRRRIAQQAEQSWQKARENFLQIQEQLEALRAAAHELEEKIQSQQGQRDEVRDRYESLNRNVAIMRERRLAIERQLEESRTELPELETQFDSSNAELQAAVTDLEEAQKQLAEQKQQQDTFESSFKLIQAEIDRARSRVGQLERLQRGLRNQIAQGEGQLVQIQEQIKDQRPVGDSPQTVELTQKLESLHAVAASAQARVTETAENRSAQQKLRRETDKTIKELRRKLDEHRRALNKAQNNVARQQTRVEMLDQLRSKSGELGEGAQVIGQLAQFLDIPDQYQRPIEAALQNRLETLIVENESTLWKLIDKRQPDQAAVLISNREFPPFERIPTPSGGIGWADQLVTNTLNGGKADGSVVNWLLHTILLTPDANTAYRLAPKLPANGVAVSLDGTVVHASGLVDLPRLDNQNSRLAREQAWREAAEKLESQASQATRAQTEVNETRDALRAENKKLDEINRERQRLGHLQQEAEQRYNRAQRDADRQEQQITYAQRQKKQQQERVAKLESRITGLQQSVTDARQKLTTSDGELATAQEKLAALPVGEAQQQREVLKQQISATRSIVDGRRAIVDSRRATLNQIKNQINRLKARRQEWSEQLLGMNIKTDEAAVLELRAQLSGLDDSLTPFRATLREKQTQMRRTETDASAAQKALHDLEAAFTRGKVALTQHETHIDNLKERIKSELGVVSLSYDDDLTGDKPLPLTEVVDELPQVDELPEGIEQSIQHGRNQLRRMGAINPDAPAEYAEVQERHDFLVQQVDDLEKTEEQLRKVIAELDELTSRAFADTVKKVDVVFGTMFTRLFGGGSAELVLTEPDDLTVSGVDIIARLPGRRPQGLALLSGGERSLTAASLIFALLKVSPTPFCVMDEVDAALDEANVNRFRDVLKELSGRTQFIVITHNRGTVQAASAIYGITMGTDSASQVISIRPDEYMTQAPLLKQN